MIELTRLDEANRDQSRRSRVPALDVTGLTVELEDGAHIEMECR